MEDIDDGGDQTTKMIRRVARIWSLVIIGFTLVMVIAHVVEPEPQTTDYPPIENLLPLAMCLSVAGLGIAWRREKLGGVINIIFFLVNLGLYWFIRGRFFPLGGVAILSLAIVPGVLFLVCWWRSKSRSSLHSS
jgi:hypothetical protein